MSQPAFTAGLVIIGNEILSGRTQDANIKFLASRLSELGIALSEVRVVPDIPVEIISAVNAMRARYTYLFTTGGIGPTHDDITTDCIAEAFGVPVERNPEAVARLQSYYRGELTDARLRMANIPQGATLIDNPVSGAPGYRLENVHVFAGVPRIMQAMFDGMAHELDGGAPIRSYAVSIRLPESRIADQLLVLQDRFPEVPLGSYPFARNDVIGTTLVARSADAAALASVAAALDALVAGLGVERLPDPV
ncbi:MAG: competence/damage-inducible protein A [Gammaproteobacteria bacterium]|nr:competence/damage-inducible protein A [Gammaproteobacteria bacterium]